MRSDSRQPAELRPLACTQGLLTSADGSARFTQGMPPSPAALGHPHQPRTGSTSALSSVYGPCEVPLKKELADRAVLEVTIKLKVPRHSFLA